jgi:tetratricopeptide (TPR) repeat protein
MLTVRCTQKLLRYLRHAPAADPDTAAAEPDTTATEPDTADTTTLGEWYAHLITVGRGREVLFVNAGTLLVVVVKAAPFDRLMADFRTRLAVHLGQLGVDDRAVDRELDETGRVILARTRNRSLVGVMNRIAFEIPIHRDTMALHGKTGDLELEWAFATSIVSLSQDDYPIDLVRRRFALPPAGAGPERHASHATSRAGSPGAGGHAIAVRRYGKREWEFVYEQIDPDVIDTFDGALDMIDAGRAAAGRRILERLAGDYPEFIDVLHHLAMIRSDQGNDAAALALWQRAVETGLRALPKTFRIGRDRLPWGLLDNRPFLRAYHGLALEVDRRGRVEEAAGMYRNLLAFNPDDNQGARALLASAFLRLGDDKAALAHCLHHADGDETMPDIIYGLVLALLRLDRAREARAALSVAVERLPLVAEEIVRERHLPPQDMNPGYLRVGGADQAYYYWLDTGVAWESTPGAVDFVAAFLKERAAAPGKGAGVDNVIPFPGRTPRADESDADEFPADALIEATAQHLHQFLKDNFPHAPGLLGLIDTEAFVRLRPLNDAFTRAREARGLSIKDVSKALKVPQYRLCDIEGASRRHFHHAVFVKYRDFLDLGDFTARWARDNAELAERLGIE